MSEEQYEDDEYSNDYEDTPTSQSTRQVRPQPRDPVDTPPRGVRRPPAPRDDYDYTDDVENTPLPRSAATPRPNYPPEAQYPSQQRRRPAPLPPPPAEYYPPEPQPRRAKRPPKPAPNRRESGLYLPWWSLVIMLVFVGCAAVGALLVVNSITPPVPLTTPIVIVITSTPTIGPPASPTALSLPPTISPTAPLPTIPPTASLPPGDFGIGKIVQVVGTGESGLNVHSGAGISAPVNFRAKDGDRFVIQGGPQSIDGSDWWLIQDQNNPTTRQGWASRNYLQTIAVPGANPTATTKP